MKRTSVLALTLLAFNQCIAQHRAVPAGPVVTGAPIPGKSFTNTCRLTVPNGSSLDIWFDDMLVNLDHPYRIVLSSSTSPGGANPQEELKLANPNCPEPQHGLPPLIEHPYHVPNNSGAQIYYTLTFTDCDKPCGASKPHWGPQLLRIRQINATTFEVMASSEVNSPSTMIAHITIH